MKIDRRRALRAAVLALWTVFFGWLWISGEMTRYLGPRTYWVIVFGTLALGTVALAHFLSLRTSDEPAPIRLREVLALLSLLVPLAAVALVPDAELGALAASRKLSGASSAIDVSKLAPEKKLAGYEPSFIDFFSGSVSAAYARNVGLKEGREIELLGFVSSEEAKVGFYLTRFYVSCCAADGIPYSVLIDPGEQTALYEEDQWLSVTGEVAKLGKEFILRATEISEAEEPDNPYL